MAPNPSSPTLRLIKSLDVDEINKALREIQDSMFQGLGSQNGTSLSVLGTGSVTLTTAYKTIPGVVLPRLGRPGTWLILLRSVVNYISTDSFVNLTIQFGSGQAEEPDVLQVSAAQNTEFTVSGWWIKSSASGDEIVSGRAKKLSGSGTSSAGVSVATGNKGSRLDAIWLYPLP